MNSTICQSNANELKAKTLNVVNDGSNIVCVSCGKDVFMLSYEKYVTRYALSVDSKVKRALFTSHVAAKSSNLGATFVVVKSRFSVAKTPTSTNKVSSASSLSHDSSQEVVCTKGDDGDVMFIEIVKKNDNSRKEEPEAGGLLVLPNYVGIKKLHDDLGVNIAKVRVTAAKHNLVLLVILVKNMLISAAEIKVNAAAYNC
ncbi:hypothetical protein Tco_0347592 [Tanacetum coccineum]